MNPSKTLLAALLLAAVLPAQARERIVALSPDVADVLVALGATQDIVGRDQTSTNPALKNVKSIGIFRQLSPEPVAALKPTLAVGSWMVQPPSVYQRLNQLGIKAVNVAPDDHIAAYPASIRKIGQLIGKSKEADALAGWWQVKTPLPTS